MGELRGMSSFKKYTEKRLPSADTKAQKICFVHLHVLIVILFSISLFMIDVLNDLGRWIVFMLSNCIDIMNTIGGPNHVIFERVRFLILLFWPY